MRNSVTAAAHMETEEGNLCQGVVEGSEVDNHSPERGTCEHMREIASGKTGGTSKLRSVKAKRTTLPAKSWVVIQARYEAGDKVVALAKEYGVAVTTICSRAKREGWLAHGAKKAEYKAEAEARVGEDIAAAYAREMQEATERHLAACRRIRELSTAFLANVVEHLNWADRETARRMKIWELKKAAGDDPLQIPIPIPASCDAAVLIFGKVTNVLLRAIQDERILLGIADKSIFEVRKMYGLGAFHEREGRFREDGEGGE